MKLIKTTDAIGHILCHDITKIVPGEFKGAAFKKGDIVKEGDIQELLNIGKEHLYIFELGEENMHENDAAIILGELGAGENVLMGKEVREGKIDLFSEVSGVLKVNRELLFRLNSLKEISFSTLPNNYPVIKKQKIAGTRVIPLIIPKIKMELAKKAVTENILKVLPFKKYKFGVVITGSEIYNGRIEDKFAPVIMDKVQEYGSEVVEIIYSDDNREMIKESAKKLIEMGVDSIIFTGGMSVDPDDLTPSSIIELGGELVSYGSPVLPGAMFLLSYLGDMPLIGLPGCAMYAKRTVFDLILPRILTGERLVAEDISELGDGGLCQGCAACHFPNCSFGK